MGKSHLGQQFCDKHDTYYECVHMHHTLVWGYSGAYEPKKY